MENIGLYTTTVI